MAETERTIVDDVVDGLDSGDSGSVTPASVAPFQGGSETRSMNSGPGTSPGGAVAGLHEGSETRPLGGDYFVPTGGAEDGVAAQARADAFAASLVRAKAIHAAADESLRRFCSGHFAPVERDADLDHFQNLQDTERTKP